MIIECNKNDEGSSDSFFFFFVVRGPTDNWLLCQMDKGFWFSLRSSKESGAALIELALSLPVLFLLVAGLVDFGNIFTHYQTISGAAREAARLGASVINIDYAYLNRGEIAPKDLLSCSHLSEEGECDMGEPSSIECLAFSQARASLNNAGFNPEKWDIDVSISSSGPSGPSGAGVNLLTVEITGDTSENCILCFSSLVGQTKFSSKSSFAWESGGCV